MSSSVEDIAVTARRTESLDAYSISLLVNSHTDKIFGRINVARLIEKANLAITIVNGRNEIVGHAAFYDYPNHNNVEHMHWMSMFKDTYSLLNCNSLNTLFVHYFVYKDGFSRGILKEILKTVYHAVPFLQYIFLMKPINPEIPDDVFNEFFEEICPIVKIEGDTQLLVSYRHSHCPMLHIRKARIEDHDDLMPIFCQNNKHLTSIYGDFFLAELIEAQDENNQCLVADVDGVAVGFISASTDVNTELLKDNFNLDVFNNCVKKLEKTKAVVKPQTPTKSNHSSDEQSQGSASASRKSPLKPPTSGSRKGSPVKVVSRKSKLSTSHLENRSSTASINDPENEVEYMKETFEVDSVFCIQLFCIHDNYECRSIDFLPALFDMFQEKDFAIITVPHSVAEFPLIQHFQRISPKPTSTFNQELYLFNKNGMFTTFNVRKCVSDDTPKINELTEGIQGHEYIMKDLYQYNQYRRDEDGVFIHAYVAEVNNCIIGICIFRLEKDIDYIRSHYNIEDYIYFQLYESSEHAQLHHLVLNPIFQHYSKYFIKEIFYQSNVSSFYYPIYYAFHEPKNVKAHSLVTCLDHFVSVSSRRQIIYPTSSKLNENIPVDEVLLPQEPYALYHINRKLTLEPKVAVNSRIVVVGGSDVGLSLLATLVFCPHLCFNNLTLVSTEDILNNATSNDSLFFTENVYNRKEMSLLGLSTWVNVVQGKICKIDRKSKNISITSNNGKLPYDHLILCTGAQYHVANPTGADIDTLITTSEALTLQQSQVYKGDRYTSIFDESDLQFPNNLLNWIRNSHSEAKVIVYGESIEAYTCIHGLIESNVHPSCIYHVKPTSDVITCFADQHVRLVMQQHLHKIGVKGFVGYTLAQYHTEENMLTSASFTSDSKPLTLECQAFICVHKRSVDYSAFRAINDCFLVFDGRLVIDSEFRTNDDSIRGAGPLSKYARRYHRDNWSHHHCNSKEVGEKLANSLLQLFDPTLDMPQNPPKYTLPKFTQPLHVSTRLPGGLFMLHVYKGSPSNSHKEGIDLVTNVGDDESYFRIHLNEYNTIDEIVCLSSKEIAVNNYLCLFGMHERYLNNLLQRYKEGMLTDFYSFFEEGWCLAIYLDRFTDFRAEVRDLMATSTDENSTSLCERIRQIIIEDGQLTDDQRVHMSDIFVGTQTKTKLEERLASFLDYNKYHLPMYARPAML